MTMSHDGTILTARRTEIADLRLKIDERKLALEEQHEVMGELH
jgi:hypothetical protein